MVIKFLKLLLTKKHLVLRNTQKYKTILQSKFGKKGRKSLKVYQPYLLVEIGKTLKNTCLKG